MVSAVTSRNGVKDDSFSASLGSGMTRQRGHVQGVKERVVYEDALFLTDPDYGRTKWAAPFYLDQNDSLWTVTVGGNDRSVSSDTSVSNGGHFLWGYVDAPSNLLSKSADVSQVNTISVPVGLKSSTDTAITDSAQKNKSVEDSGALDVITEPASDVYRNKCLGVSLRPDLVCVDSMIALPVVKLADNSLRPLFASYDKEFFTSCLSSFATNNLGLQHYSELSTVALNSEGNRVLYVCLDVALYKENLSVEVLIHFDQVDDATFDPVKHLRAFGAIQPVEETSSPGLEKQRKLRAGFIVTSQGVCVPGLPMSKQHSLFEDVNLRIGNHMSVFSKSASSFDEVPDRSTSSDLRPQERGPSMHNNQVSSLKRMASQPNSSRRVDVVLPQTELVKRNKTNVIEVPKEVYRYVRKSVKKIVEKEQHVPGDTIAIPVPVIIEETVRVPRPIDNFEPVLLAQVVNPKVVFAQEPVSIPCRQFVPRLVPVPILIPKIVRVAPLCTVNGTQPVIHEVASSFVPSSQWNSLLVTLNQHLTDTERYLAGCPFKQNAQGEVEVLEQHISPGVRMPSNLKFALKSCQENHRDTHNIRTESEYDTTEESSVSRRSTGHSSIVSFSSCSSSRKNGFSVSKTTSRPKMLPGSDPNTIRESETESHDHMVTPKRRGFELAASFSSMFDDDDTKDESTASADVY